MIGSRSGTGVPGHGRRVKGRAALMVATGLLLLAGGTAKAGADITTGLVGHWKFDEMSGTAAADSSGNGNDAMLENGPTWTGGNIDGALTFDGVDDRVNIIDSLGVTGSQARSVCFWALPYDSTNGCTVGWGNTAAAGAAFFVSIRSGNWYLTGYGSGDWDTGLPVQTSLWQHHAVTYDGSTVTWFVDGVNAGSHTYAYNTTNTGTYVGYSTEDGCFSGVIDDVRIYNRALSALDVTALYDLGAGTPPPTITSITPSSGSPGTIVTITGADFQDGATVEFGAGNYSANVTVMSSTELQAEVPAGSGTVDLIVTNPDMQSDTLAAAFAYSSPVTITIDTNPAGLTVTVDGADYTAPFPFSWSEGSEHTLSVTSPQPGVVGERFVFAFWSDGGAQSHTYMVPAADDTVTADFSTQYQLTTAVSPAASGTVTPADGSWHDAGSVVSVSATASGGYTFDFWTGDLSGSTSPRSLTMDGPRSVTAHFFASSLPPAAPSGLTATAVSSTQIDLSWADNSTDEWDFSLDRSDGAPGAWFQLATFDPDVTSHSDTGLAPGTTYYYRICARNAYGDSAWSNEASATTLGVASPSITVTYPTGGEMFLAGSSTWVYWYVENITGDVEIVYTTDGGTSYTYLDTVPAWQGSYEWTLPSVFSTQCRVKVWEPGGGGAWGESDDFSIVNTGIAVEPEVIVFHGMAGTLGGLLLDTFTVRYVARAVEPDVTVTLDTSRLPGYLSVDTTGFVLKAGEERSVTVTLDAPGLPRETSIHEYIKPVIVADAAGLEVSSAAVDASVDIDPSRIVTGCAAAVGPAGTGTPGAALPCALLLLAALALPGRVRCRENAGKSSTCRGRLGPSGARVVSLSNGASAAAS